MARILVVGTAAWRETLRAPLLAAGHEVLSSSDAFEAIAIALGTPTAAIITQSTLDGVSGLQLCRLVNAEQPFRGIPVVIVSSEGEAGAAFQARAAGAAAHVGDTAELLRVLPGILARPEPEPFRRRVGRDSLMRRLSLVLDRALRDGEIAADVRALATVDGLERMFEGLVDLAAQILPYTWLGLVVSGDAHTFLLHAAEDDAHAEREAREVLAVSVKMQLIGGRRAVPRPSSTADGEQEAIEVPIFFGDCQVGQLAVMLPRSGDGDAKRSVGLIAYELGGPLKIMSLLEQVQRQAATDALTGLLNRRAFLDLVERERARSERYGAAPMSLLVIDIDHFKNVNDVHGHPAGDAVLRNVARAFADATRATDIVCRWGGEEFVIAIPHTNLEEALVAAERIRARIEATSHELPGGGTLHVTASIGVSAGVAAWSPEQLIAAADLGLYDAKTTGRNRVCAAPAEERFSEIAVEGLQRAS